MQQLPPSDSPAQRFQKEIRAYISVDVEASGPSPSHYALLSIGACTVSTPRQSFYVELKPGGEDILPEAMAVNQLSLEALRDRGVPPAQAMAQFESWIESLGTGQRPILVGFNVPFDWMFVADYFHRHLGRNPFGHSPIDIKGVYMGLHGVTWEESSMEYVRQRYTGEGELTHNALEDAQLQADIFEAMLRDLVTRR
jgi:DNA polymerase III epsilon subunit-like protein